MALLAGDTITAARDRHVAFDRERCPQGMALRMLAAYARRLHGFIMQIDEDMLRVETSTPFPLANFAAGIALPANRTLVAVTVQEKGNNPRSFDLDIVPVAMRNDRSTPVAAAWQVGNNVYLRGDASDWTSYASVAVSTVPIPPQVLRSDDALALPDTALDALAANVALGFALRGHADETLPAIDKGAFRDEARLAEASFLDEVRNRLTGRVFVTRDVMHFLN